ncbi:MAG: EpsG family protein [Erysipelotrichaceae bacterium]|nr:EpsG family protein [Erysipelotrichaceae bacterium]MDY5252441.1 EpsG family protein [Erysipelotrichaceae bacterium]
MIYILFYILLASVVIGKVFYTKSNYKIEICVFLLLLGIVVINFPLGPDLPSYVFSFDRVSSPIADAFKYNMQRNVGFNAFLFYTKQIKNNYIIFRLLFNLVITSLCGYTIYKYSKNKLFAMLIFFGAGYYIVYFGSGIRQMMAMAIFFFAYFNFLLEKKDLLYLLMSFIALSFHEAGIICFYVYLIYIVRNIILRYPKTFFIVSCISSLAIFYFSVNFLPIIVEKYQYISVFTHILMYLSNISIDVFGIVLRTILVLINIFLYLSTPNKNSKNKAMIVTMIAIYFFYMAFSGFSLVARIYDFVAIIEMIMIPNFIFYMKIRLKKLLCISVIILLNLILLVTDIKFTCNSEYISNYYNFNDFPYLTVFDTKTINQLIE